MAYFCPLFASYFSINYVNMQDNVVVDMRIIMSTCKKKINNLLIC